MKNILVISLIISLFYNCQSQNYPVTSSEISWEKGDQVQLNLVLSQAKTVNGIEDEKYFIKRSFEIEVLEENDSSFVLNFEEENPMLVNISAKFSSINPDKSSYQRFARKLVINKDSKEFNCINSEEYAEIIQKSYEELKMSLDLIPDSQKTEFLDELEGQNKNYKSADESEVLDLVLARYRHDFKVDDPTVKIDSSANPFNLQRFPGGKVTTYAIKGESSRNYNLHVNTSYDFESYKGMLSNLTSGLSNAMSGLMPGDEAAENDIGGMMNQMMSQLMAQIDFDASNEIVITQSNHKKWPTEIMALNAISIKQAGKTEKVNGSALIEINQ